MADHNHTARAYNGLADAYVFFNAALFNNQLPSCLITLQRHKGAYGYFSNQRFTASDCKTDEIALNPATFGEVSVKHVLSTLVHEMCHLQQYRFGEPSRNGYHNKQWAKYMKAVGLQPSDTAQPGGKESGARVSHYVINGGVFDVACDKFLSECEFVLYADNQSEAQKKKSKKKADSKTKYTCQPCEINAWAKPKTLLICGLCRTIMVSSSAEEAGEDDELGEAA